MTDNKFLTLAEEIREDIRPKVHYRVFLAGGDDLATIIEALELAGEHEKREQYRARVRKFCQENNITPNNAELVAISGQRFEEDLLPAPLKEGE